MKKLILLLGITATFCASQDFGYEYSAPSEYRSIGFGYHLQDFRASSSNPLSDSNRIAFSTNMPTIELRQVNGRLAIGYQNFTDINGKERNAFSVSGETHNDLSLTSSRESKPSFFIPIVVSANYVRAQSPNKLFDNFDVGSLGVGTGIKYKYFDRSFGIQAFAVASLMYASQGFSTEYGSETSLAGEVQMVFPGILFEGILVGYRYESQRWNMSSNVNDYQRWYHGGFIGLMF